MKRILCVFGLLIFISALALAAPMTIDLQEMTPAQLQEFKKQVEQEYNAATDFPSKTVEMLTENVKSLFESTFSNGESYSYPWLGFSTSRSRSMYMLSGNCTVKYSDGSRQSYDVSAYYWYDDAAQKFNLALFLLDKTVTIKNDVAVEQISIYLDEATKSLLDSSPASSNSAVS